MDIKFYICRHCGNIIEKVADAGVPVMCCGQKMEELVPGAVDGALEKHVPVVTVDGNLVKVEVGSVAHPMLPEHSIQWVYLVTDKRVMRYNLQPGVAPVADFALLPGEKPVAAYEYCNLHGLWKKDI